MSRVVMSPAEYGFALGNAVFAPIGALVVAFSAPWWTTTMFAALGLFAIYVVTHSEPRRQEQR